VTYHGATDAKLAAAPAPAKNAGTTAQDAIASLPVPPGGTAAQVALGARIFHGEVSNGTCAGCHGSDAKGSPIGADLTSGTWLWSDGSVAGISKTIAQGVASPKQHLGAMPPMGGSPLSNSDLQAVTAYVWALGHQAAK
jgi:mono/diheme cytochrome c family protein